MKRQELIRCIILTGLIFLFACSERKTPSDTGRRFLFPTPLLFHSRPDIVFNTTDQQSAKALNLRIKTPRINSLNQKPWKRHTIDDSSFGADGTRICYANADSLPDIVTGWEQGNVARLYFNPGKEKLLLPWPYLEVPGLELEDAFAVDIDSDGFKDIITLSEGEERRITIHWAPSDLEKYKKSNYWLSEDIPATIGRKWMFGIPMDVDNKNGIDLVVGSKKQGGSLGWLESPPNPRDINKWKYHEISTAGWIMSIERMDLNHDGHDDILISDRRGGDHTGVRWLENPGPGSALYKHWNNHLIGMDDGEPMFLDIADLNGNGLDDIIVPQNKIQEFAVFFQSSNLIWKRTDFAFPQFSGERGKAVAVGDIDGDGNWDVVSTYENAGGKAGVMWTSALFGRNRRDYNVSGTGGKKFDLILLLDMDGDGDLDILTSEENSNSADVKGLGVIWYENPSK
ncbi:MAG: FG-GAP repeat domain-containing protein [Prolixibacteraceae bacterium]